MRLQKPIASLSLDLDNKWSYLKIHGDPGWEVRPSYLEIVVPRVLAFLAQRKLKITFFVVGQDAALKRNRDTLKMIAAEGHEIGNHSFSHEPWLHLDDHETIEREIVAAEEQICEIAGQRPVGFRGPGFSVSPAVLDVLQRRGYLYDASTLPTFLGPLARLYYLRNVRLSREEMRRRNSLFGALRNGFQTLKPHRWRSGDSLLEIPVTTMPFFRVPFHLSYILYLSTFSSALAVGYFRLALALCRLTGVAPSLLLHPLDFLGAEDKVGLDFFPAMKLSKTHKLALVSEALKMYCDRFCVVSLKEQARSVLGLTSASRVNDSVPDPSLSSSSLVK